MGLEEFRTEDLDSGDTYYLATMKAAVTIEYIGLFEKLPKDIRDITHYSAEPQDTTTEIKLEYPVEGRGYTEKEAFDAALAKIKKAEEYKFDNKLAEVIRTGVATGTDKIVEKEFEE